jgi:hypothetical protein
MLLIRPTRSLAKKLQVTSIGPDSTSPSAHPLNEWYCNDFKFARTDLVIFVNPATFLPLVLKAAPYRTLVERFREELPFYLKRLGHSNPPLNFGDEVQFTRTNDRSTIGIMVDFVKMLQFEDGYGRYGARDLLAMTDFISRTPIIARKGKYPTDMLAELLGTSSGAPRTKLRLV